MYGERAYRDRMGAHLRSFSVRHRESDLWIGVDPSSFSPGMKDIALKEVKQLWEQLEVFFATHPGIKDSLEPVEDPVDPPAVLGRMCAAGRSAGVGPMAAVAGAFAGSVGEALVEGFGPTDIMVENGGDIWLSASGEVVVSVFAGSSPLSERIGIRVRPEDTPLGICTSSGTVGPSLSFGRADAVMVCSRDPALADAYATSLGNLVKGASDIEPVLDRAKVAEGVLGVLVVVGDRMGIWGRFEFVGVGTGFRARGASYHGEQGPERQ